MAHDREVAGIRCTEVLADLSAYLDGDLSAGRVARIDAHLAGCDWCEQFGGEFADMIAALREELSEPEPVPEDVIARLQARLDRLE